MLTLDAECIQSLVGLLLPHILTSKLQPTPHEQNFKKNHAESNVVFSSNGVVFCVFASCWIESMINMTKKLNDLKKYFIMTFILHQMILFQKQ